MGSAVETKYHDKKSHWPNQGTLAQTLDPPKHTSFDAPKLFRYSNVITY